jgi:hypothetical protein
MQIFKEAGTISSTSRRPMRPGRFGEFVEEGIRRGEIKGWRRYENNRRFAKYGRQRGWKRMISEKAPEPQQHGFRGGGRTRPALEG